MTIGTAQRNDAVLALCGLALYVPAVGRYGWKLLLLLVLSMAMGALLEWGVAALQGRRSLVYGVPAWVLFPLVIPPAFPLWMSLASLAFAVLVTVAFFGGHGRQVAAPVAVGEAFALLSFPAAYGQGWVYPLPSLADGAQRFSASLPSVDHPLVLLAARDDVAWADLLAGAFPQAPAMALPVLLLGLGLLLLLLRAVAWRTTLSLLLAYGLLAAGRSGTDIEGLARLFLAGNVLFAAFLIVADARVCARTRAGQVLTGVAAGVAAFAIRTRSSFPDGTCFAVLLANVFAPLLDEIVLRAEAWRARPQAVAAVRQGASPMATRPPEGAAS